MKERNISEKEVEEVLKSEDTSYLGNRGETNAIKKIKKGRKVRVTYVMERKKKIIITAMIVS